MAGNYRIRATLMQIQSTNVPNLFKTLKMKYKLTFWQKIQLVPIWFLWASKNPHERKTWHEVKKSMEKHDHKFTIPYSYKGYMFLKCEHEGCNLCEPVD